MPHPLVPVHAATHGVVLDLAYATSNNMVGRAIYDRALCLLHRDAEICLRKAVVLAAQSGYRLKIFDAFRPHEAQVALWEAATDKAFVADPHIGSHHTRGTAIDLTLVDAQGQELDMGTDFDAMTEASHHFSTLVSPQAQAHRLLLLHTMEAAGFVHLAHEWWHYSLPGHENYAPIASAVLGDLSPMARI